MLSEARTMLLLQIDWAPPRFGEEPLDWIDYYVVRGPVLVLVVFAVLVLMVICHHYWRAARIRATTPDGPDADYRDPA